MQRNAAALTRGRIDLCRTSRDLVCRRRSFLRGLYSVNADLFLRLRIRLEFHVSVNERKQCVILAQTDIFAGFHARAVLANQDGTGADKLSVETFHTQTLGITVASVAGRAAAFFVSHFQSSVVSRQSSDGQAIGPDTDY